MESFEDRVGRAIKAGFISAPTGAQEIVLEATIRRADGTIEKLGEIAYYHKNPLRVLWWRIKKLWR